MHNEGQHTRAMALHSQLPLLVAAYGDAATSRVSCWDYMAAKRTSTFASGGGAICAIEMLNPETQPLLLIGHAGGAVQIWSGFERSGEERLLAAWNADDAAADYRYESDQRRRHSDSYLGFGGTGYAALAGANDGADEPSAAVGGGARPLLLEWMQHSGLLLSAAVGDGATRVWDVERELCVARVAAADPAGVSSLCTDPSGGPLLAVGYGGGAVQLWDRRAPMQLHSVATLSLHNADKHGTACTHLCMRPGCAGQVLMSASAAGSVRLCDMRAGGAPQELYNSTNVATIAAHAEQPILAVGSRRQLLKLYHLETRRRITIKAHGDFWGSRLGSVASLRFHPTQPLLAAGAANDHLSVFSYDATSWTAVI